jgi:peptide/nickel transport system substrate-binding protein
VAKVEFRYFSTPAAEISALRSGQIDIIDNLPVPQSVPSLKSAGFTVDIGPTSGKVQLTLNNAYGPLRKQLVRQAISYALTKKAMDQAAEAGYGRIIGSDSVPGDPYFLPKLANLYPHSVRKAKTLLAKAGYPHGFRLELVLPPYPYAKADGPVVAAELKQVGIDVTLSNIQWPLWLSQVFEAGDFQSTIIDQAEVRDISNYANPKYYWHYADTREVTALLTQGNEAPTRAQWVSSYQRAETLIARQAVNVWFFNLPEITVAKRGIVGLPHGSLSESFQLSALKVGGRLGAQERRLGFTS